METVQHSCKAKEIYLAWDRQKMENNPQWRRKKQKASGAA